MQSKQHEQKHSQTTNTKHATKKLARRTTTHTIYVDMKTQAVQTRIRKHKIRNTTKHIKQQHNTNEQQPRKRQTKQAS